MNYQDRLDPNDMLQATDDEFQLHVRKRARAMAPQALETYQEVMLSSDDDQARINAADRVLKLSDAQEEKAPQALISEDLLKGALAGLMMVAGIAKEGREKPILKDVSVPRADTRAVIPVLALPQGKESERQGKDDEEAFDESLDFQE
jgi:hypothetical protein